MWDSHDSSACGCSSKSAGSIPSSSARLHQRFVGATLLVTETGKVEGSMAAFVNHILLDWRLWLGNLLRLRRTIPKGARVIPAFGHMPSTPEMLQHLDAIDRKPTGTAPRDDNTR